MKAAKESHPIKAMTPSGPRWDGVGTGPVQVSSTLQMLMGNRAVHQWSTLAAPPAATTADRLDVARGGLAGSSHPLPHRAEMEALFGMPLGHLRAYTNEGAARANAALGAQAYSLGDDLAFGTAGPTRQLVAHEVMHALRNGQQGASEATEEALAEVAERRVGGAITSPAANPVFGSLASGTRTGEPRLLCKPGPATPGRISTIASGTRLEQAFEYAFARPFPAVPIPLTPAKFQLIPELRLSGRVGGDYRGESAGSYSYRGLASGRAILLVFLGNPYVAEIFASATPSLDVSFTFTNHGAAADPSPGTSPAWTLDLPKISLRGSLRTGVRLGRRSTEYGYELASGELVTLETVRITPQGVQFGRITWNPTVVKALRAGEDSIGRAVQEVEQGFLDHFSPFGSVFRPR